jgi:hypothetical protein
VSRKKLVSATPLMSRAALSNVPHRNLISHPVAEAVSLCVVILGTLAGTLNAMGWVAVLIYLVGAVGCLYFLTGAKRLAAV